MVSMSYIRLMENEDYERTEKEYRKADHASEGTNARSHHHDSDLPTEEKVSLALLSRLKTLHESSLFIHYSCS